MIQNCIYSAVERAYSNVIRGAVTANSVEGEPEALQLFRTYQPFPLGSDECKLDCEANMNTTILLLCSDSLVRSVIEEALQSEGYLVLSTGDIGAAVDRLEEHRCRADLLVLPHYIDSMAGHEAAVYLRTKCSGLRVLLIGGLLDDDRLRNREVLQAFEVFPKPFTAAELLRKVKEVLATRPDGTM